MEAIIEKANKLLPFGLRAQKLVPFFIGVKLVSFAFFAIFMMNRQWNQKLLDLFYYLYLFHSLDIKFIDFIKNCLNYLNHQLKKNQKKFLKNKSKNFQEKSYLSNKGFI